MRVADGAIEVVEASGGGDEPPEGGPRRPRWPWLIGLGVVVALVLGVVAVERSGDHPATLTPAEVSSTVSSLVKKGIDDAGNAPPASATAYRTIQPSLVYISAKRTGTASEDVTSGAGVVIDASGQILTARHVVTGADSIEVTFADGTQTAAQITTDQPANDIAVLAPASPPGVIVPAVLGGGVQVGDDVVRRRSSPRPRRLTDGRRGVGAEPDRAHRRRHR